MLASEVAAECLKVSLYLLQRLIVNAVKGNTVFFNYFILLAMPHGLQDLSSLTRDGTWAHSSERAKS